MSVGKVLLTHLFTPRCANWQRNIPIFAMQQCWNAFPGKTQMILLRRCFPERWKMSRSALPSTAETTGCFSRRILLWCMSRILGAAPQSSPGKQKNKEKLSLTLRIENAIPTRSKKTSLPKITSGGCLQCSDAICDTRCALYRHHIFHICDNPRIYRLHLCCSAGQESIYACRVLRRADFCQNQDKYKSEARFCNVRMCR